MADQPISLLSTLTTYSTSDLMEILDVSDTTYAPSGTNKKVTVQNLLSMVSPIGVPSGGTGLGTLTAHGVMLGEGTSSPGFATIGTAGNVLTDQGTGVDPVFAPIPNATVVSAVLAASYTLTASFANVGLSITLPSAGTYILLSGVRSILNITQTTPQYVVSVQTQLYNATSSVVVPNSPALPFQLSPPGNVSMVLQTTAVCGPVAYTVSGAAVIQLQGNYLISGGGTGSLTSAIIVAGSNGATNLVAWRIS